MSLEIALQENTTVMRELLNVLNTFKHFTGNINSSGKPIEPESPIVKAVVKAQEKSVETVTDKQISLSEIPLSEISDENKLSYVKDVQPLTIKVSQEKGRDTAVRMLSRFGVKKAQELEPSQWPAFIAAANAVLSGGDE